MPFDASGNFTRVYNFQQDRDNGIKILAARVDGEFDNVATGMNAVFFRDGRVPMQADLRLNLNGISGLKDGALGTPAVKFNTDAVTGPYLDGVNRYGIQVNSLLRGVFTAAGFDVTGNITATGTISQAGSQVAGLLSPAFTGTPTAPTAAVGNNGTQIATTAFVQNGFLPISGGTVSGNVTVGGGGLVVGSDTIPGCSLYMNAASGNIRTYGFLTGGAYAADIALQTDNATLKHNCTTAHRFDVGGAQQVIITGNSTTVKQLNVANGSAGTVYLGPTGNAYLSFDGTNYAFGGTGGITGAGYTANSNVGSFNVGFSSSRAGQVGYHMYNNGAVTEWVVYQPAHATSDDFRIGTGLSGVVTDRFKITPGGDTYALGNTSVKGEIWVGQTDTTGMIRFGNAGSGSTKYLQYDGAAFQLSASLVVGGNISSTSDARLKSGVRTFENGLALVKKMQPKRFNMYGKDDFGFIAQDLQPLVPEIVSRDSKGYLSVDYGRLTAVLASAVHSLDERIERIERFLVL